jgi:hypothetical protein
MSLTSYRAAPPRDGRGRTTDERGRMRREYWVWRLSDLVAIRPLSSVIRRLVLARPGGDLLFRGLSRSTIGAEGFHGRVRDGIGCLAPRHDHQAKQRPEDSGRITEEKCVFMRGLSLRATGLFHPSSDFRRPSSEHDQADRAISTGWHVHCCACTSGLST